MSEEHVVARFRLKSGSLYLKASVWLIDAAAALLGIYFPGN
jgi:hypothetical protein